MNGKSTQTPDSGADLEDAIQGQVQQHVDERTPLYIAGSGSKAGLGRAVSAPSLELSGHRGITSFEPTELVLSARAGTPITEIEAVLTQADQMLPFEPPRIGGNGTLGGAIATGLSGPRRPYAGAARDFVLGTRVINGQGQVLRFGGEVMKNVAGYDVSRLMAGAYGTLGVLLEVSMKVLPKPAVERHLMLEMATDKALDWMVELARHPWPVSALCHVDGTVHVRLSGTEAGVSACEQALGGENSTDQTFWDQGRDFSHPFFAGDLPTWRVAVPPGTPQLALDGDVLSEWGGTLRWYRTRADATTVRAAADAVNGHAMRFEPLSTPGAESPFHPLRHGLDTLHTRLKQAFDPNRLLNPGRMYADL